MESKRRSTDLGGACVMAGCSDQDGNGRKLLGQGAWNADSSVSVLGGQGVSFQVTNINVVGTVVEITGRGQTQSATILPGLTATLDFSFFGQEPISWDFEVSSPSDAFIVSWCLYSTWA